jgi:hypothetical protein
MSAYSHLKDNNLKLDELISLEGNTKRVWSLAQFKTFLRQFTGLSDAEMNSNLADKELVNMWLSFLTEYVAMLNTIEIMGQLTTATEIKEAKAQNLICCAIGLEALGIVANILMSQSLINGTATNWSLVKDINQINFCKSNKR